jgi:hypothetical protein
MEMPPDTLETVGVNELFVVVTVDTSFTTEQTVVGHIDEIHILIEVRIVTIVGYLSPSQVCDACALLSVRKLDMVMPPDSLEDFLTKETRVSVPWCVSTSSLSFSICPSRPGDFFVWGNLFFSRIRDQYRWNRQCLRHPHFRTHVQLNVC